MSLHGGDLKDLERWDEGKISIFCGELKEIVRKPGSAARIISEFDPIFKQLSQPVADSIVETFSRLTGLTLGDKLGLFHGLVYLPSKITFALTKRILKNLLSEISTSAQLAEVSDDTRTSLMNVLKAEEFQDLELHVYAAFKEAASEQFSRFASVGGQEEFGCQCSATVDSFRKAIGSVGRLEDEVVASILISVLRISPSDEKRGEVGWNYEVVAEVLRQDTKTCNWAKVVAALDQPRFVLRSESEFQVLVQLILRISGAPIPPLGLVQKSWNNARAQFTLLALLANVPRNVIDFAPLITQDQILQGESIAIPANFSWLCPLFHARLLDLSMQNLTMEVLEVFMKAKLSYPEYLLATLAVVNHVSPVRNEVIQRLLPEFCGLPGSRPSSAVVMRRLFSTNTDLLFRLCLVMMKKATKTTEIQMAENIVRNMGGQYQRLLDSDSSIEDLLGYWCVKSDRHELNLEEKLKAVVDVKTSRALMSFVKLHLESLRNRVGQAGPTDGIMSVEALTAIIRVLQQFPVVISSDELKPLMVFCTQFQQQAMQNASHQRDVPAQVQPDPRMESDDVESLANAYFQKIYTTDIAIVDIVAMLRQFKTSSEKKEQELFRCMVHNLFDEYRFFHKYPDKELNITARLFGALVQHQLVSSITLGIALRYVLEALRKDPELGDGNDKMFRFGHIALDQFRSRLTEWPQYCSHLIQIPHLSRLQPDLFQEAQRALASPPIGGGNQQNAPGFGPGQEINFSVGQQVAAATAGVNAGSFPGLSVAQPQSTIGRQEGLLAQQTAASLPPSAAAFVTTSGSNFEQAGLWNSVPVATMENRESERDRMVVVNLAVEEQMVPADNVRDSIHFIVNNIAKNNVEVKAQELKAILKSEMFAWFANYLVEKRVSSQPNLHSLYLNLLEVIDSADLNRLIVDSTLFNVTKFLSSPNITSSTSERSILRHFGMWLGQLTLARNKPLLQRRINLKQLIFWGYETGHLIAVCPFVAKVVEGVKDSKVFRPPNPWLMAILGVLKELAEIEDLKLNIKFEVQVLCKNISVGWEDITKSSTLGACRQPVKDSKNPDFNLKAQQSQSAASASQGMSPAVPTPPVSAPQPAEVKPTMESTLDATAMEPAPVQAALNLAVSQAAAAVVVNPSLAFFANNPTQRRVVAAAVERGIREISNSAIERSVALAVSTTKQLLLKDFVAESNDVSMRKAAHTMVSSLAGSLSLAICKEPLRISISNHLRTMLAPAISDQTTIEQIVTLCANDNIELGSSLIERASTEKAIKDVDEAIAEALTARKVAREKGQQFLDSTMPRCPTRLPPEVHDALVPNPLGLTAAQFMLYETFGKAQVVASGAVPAPDARGVAPNPGSISMSQALEAYQAVYTRLDISMRNVVNQLQAQGRELSMASLGDHEITQLIKDIVVVTQKILLAVRNETAMTFCESIFNKLFDTANVNPLRLEVFVTALDAVRDACGGVKVFDPDFITWLGKYSGAVNDEFSRRLYRHVLLLLIRFKLVRPQDLDPFLYAHMENGLNIFWLELTLTFIKQCVVDGFSTIFDFPVCVESIQQMRPVNMNVRKSLQKWLLDMKAIATTNEERKQGAQTTANTASKENSGAKIQVSQLLEKWLSICNTITDQLFGQFLQLLQQVGVFRTDDATDRFVFYSVEVCVEASLKSCGPEGQAPMNFTFMDGLAKLFTLLIRVADKDLSSDSVAPRPSQALLNRILSSVSKILLEDHETKRLNRTFDQRPYYRLLSNMSQDFGIPSDDRPDLILSVLPLAASHCQCYLQISPVVAPAFACSWLLLISKRSLLPYLLRNQKGWHIAHKLIIALLTFLNPLLRRNNLADPVKKLYKGTLRLFLVVLHDFPEFLSDFHASFCDAIPPNCVQLRNLVLSAFPRAMRLPDPFSPNLRWESLPEALQAPRIVIDNPNILSNAKLAIDNYLNTQQPADFAHALATSISGNLSTPLVSAVVLYIGSQSCAQPIRGSGVDLLRGLVLHAECDARFLILNAIVNQLRFPNSHTYFFFCVVLALFLMKDGDAEKIQEQITRIFLERLVAHRPHPWGLLVTFIELIKNPKFNFWKKPFVKCSADVERVLESLARSCLGSGGAV